MSSSPPQDSESLGKLVSAYIQRVRDGEVLSIEAFLAEVRIAPAMQEALAAAIAEEITETFPAGSGSPAASSSGEDGETDSEFELLEELGQGRTGSVFRAYQASEKRHVAIKLLSAEASQNAQYLQRLRREAAILRHLVHPGIVRMFGTGKANRRPFLVMELIPDGRTLSSTVAERHAPFSESEVIAQGMVLAEALLYCHCNGIVHRDIKPNNVMLLDDIPKLTDFGSAFITQDNRLTTAGMIIGTLSYMSPEQLSGEPDPNPQWDVYSLGATLYFALTGHPPFEGKTLDEMVDFVLRRDPLPPREHGVTVSRELEAIVLKCMAKQPGNRYQMMADVSEDLSACAAGRPVSAPLVNWTLRRFKRRFGLDSR